MKDSNKKRRGRKVWIAVAAIVGVITIGMVSAIAFTAPGRNELQNMRISKVNFRSLRDGTYAGAYRGTKDSTRNAAVTVTVASGVVTNIQVTGGVLADEKQSTEVRNGLTIKSLFDRVIDAQSLQVDVISGATLTSNAHLKAVEDALIKAQGK